MDKTIWIIIGIFAVFIIGMLGQKQDLFAGTGGECNNDNTCSWTESQTCGDCLGNFKIYLPANLQKEVPIYISDDGSTYYDSSMTQLAKGADSSPSKNPLKVRKIDAINVLGLSKRDYCFRGLAYIISGVSNSFLTAYWLSLADVQLGGDEFYFENELTQAEQIFFIIGQGANSQCITDPIIIDGDYISIRYDNTPLICNTPADVNCNNVVERTELGAYAMKWINGQVTRQALGQAAMAWIQGG